MRFAVEGKNCSGITMEDGTHYEKDVSGGFDVRDEGHQAWIQRSENFKRGYIRRVTNQSVRFPNIEDLICDSCGRNNFPWTTTCGRCGASLEQPEQVAS